MKKLVTLLLAAGLVFAASQPASAIEFKPFGSAEFVFNAASNLGTFEPAGGRYAFQNSSDVMHNFGEEYHPKHSRVVQRFILGMDIVASENLSAHYDAIFGYFTWGGPSTAAAPTGGGALGTRAANIVTRQAYLDWIVPSTSVKVRMGLQAWAAPAFATGTLNPYDGDDFGTGILVTAPINDNVTVTGGWLRASSDTRRGTTATTTARTDDNFDMFILSVPVKVEGARVTPWGLVGVLGKDSTSYRSTNYATDPNLPVANNNWLPLQNAAAAAADAKGIGYSATMRGNSTVYFAGLGGELTMFDPFRFAWDFAYSGIDTKHSFTDRSGWLLGASAEYKTAYGVPTLKAWFASGDDGNINNGSERGITTGAFSRAGVLAFYGNGLGGNMILKTGAKPAGTWGVSAQWNMASFMENMFHNFHVSYVQGTNNKKMAAYADPRYVQEYMTTKDSLVELDFSTVYSIYKNLAMILDMSYIIQNFDGKNWAKDSTGALRRPDVDKLHFSNAWNIAVNLRYTF